MSGAASASGPSFKDLLVWQKALELCLALYAVTRTFPADERFGLTAELRKLPGAERALRVLAPLLRTQKDPAKVMLPYLIEWK